MDPSQCEGCLVAQAAADPWAPWIGHLVELFENKECGAFYFLNQLSVREWRGLRLLRRALADHREAKRESENWRAGNQRKLK